MSEERSFTLQLKQDGTGKTERVTVTQAGKVIPVDKNIYWSEEGKSLYAYVKDPRALDDRGGSIEVTGYVIGEMRLERVGANVTQSPKPSFNEGRAAKTIKKTLTGANVESNKLLVVSPADVKECEDQPLYADDSYDQTGEGGEEDMVYYRWTFTGFNYDPK